MARCPTTSITSQEITAPPMPLMRCRMYRRTASKSSRAGKAGGSSPTMTRMVSFATLCQVGAPVRVAEGMGSHPARSNCMVSTCFIPRPRYLEAHCTSETEAYFRLTLCSTISLPMKMLALALAAFAAVSTLAQTSGDHLYKQSAKYVLGGEGGWDYLTYDPDGDRLFITRGNHVMVVGASDGKTQGDIPAQRSHGVALVPELNRGFISNGGAGTITSFDMKTLTPLADIKVGSNPDAIIYGPHSKRVSVMHGGTKNVMVIDPESMKVTNTIDGGGKLEFAAAGPDHVYVNNEDTSETLFVDSSKWTIDKRAALKPCDSPSGIAFDEKDNMLFAGCENKMVAVIDAKSGNVTTVTAGAGIDANAFDPELGYAFSSNGQSGDITVIGQKNGKWDVVDTVPTQRGARTMTIDTKGHRLFTVTAEFGQAEAGKRPPMKPGSFTLLVYSYAK